MTELRNTKRVTIMGNSAIAELYQAMFHVLVPLNTLSNIPVTTCVFIGMLSSITYIVICLFQVHYTLINVVEKRVQTVAVLASGRPQNSHNPRALLASR